MITATFLVKSDNQDLKLVSTFDPTAMSIEQIDQAISTALNLFGFGILQGCILRYKGKTEIVNQESYSSNLTQCLFALLG